MKKILLILSVAFLGFASQSSAQTDTIKNGVGIMRITANLATNLSTSQLTTAINTAIGGAPSTEESAQVVSENNRHFVWDGTNWNELLTSTTTIPSSSNLVGTGSSTNPSFKTDASGSGTVSVKGANDVTVSSGSATANGSIDITVAESITNEGILGAQAGTGNTSAIVKTTNSAGTVLGKYTIVPEDVAGVGSTISIRVDSTSGKKIIIGTNSDNMLDLLKGYGVSSVSDVTLNGQSTTGKIFELGVTDETTVERSKGAFSIFTPEGSGIKLESVAFDSNNFKDGSNNFLSGQTGVSISADYGNLKYYASNAAASSALGGAKKPYLMKKKNRMGYSGGAQLVTY
jgi:hypothetical protein